MRSCRMSGACGHDCGERLDNNKMQQTRSGHSRWRPSQLILVLDRRRTRFGPTLRHGRAALDQPNGEGTAGAACSIVGAITR